METHGEDASLPSAVVTDAEALRGDVYVAGVASRHGREVLLRAVDEQHDAVAAVRHDERVPAAVKQRLVTERSRLRAAREAIRVVHAHQL